MNHLTVILLFICPPLPANAMKDIIGLSLFSVFDSQMQAIFTCGDIMITNSNDLISSTSDMTTLYHSCGNSIDVFRSGILVSISAKKGQFRISVFRATNRDGVIDKCLFTNFIR